MARRKLRHAIEALGWASLAGVGGDIFPGKLLGDSLVEATVRLPRVTAVIEHLLCQAGERNDKPCRPAHGVVGDGYFTFPDDGIELPPHGDARHAVFTAPRPRSRGRRRPALDDTTPSGKGLADATDIHVRPFIADIIRDDIGVLLSFFFP